MLSQIGSMAGVVKMDPEAASRLTAGKLAKVVDILMNSTTKREHDSREGRNLCMARGSGWFEIQRSWLAISGKYFRFFECISIRQKNPIDSAP